MQQMTESLLVDGCPIKSTIQVADKSFFYAGRLMAMSLLQGCRKPMILSEQAYLYLSSKKVPDVTDYSLPDSFTNKADIRKVNFNIKL